MDATQDEVKTCRKCGISKPLIKFSAHKGCTGGRESTCRACSINKEAKKRWDKAHKARNKEKIAAQVSAYQRANAEKLKAYQKKWHAENKDHVRAYMEAKKAADPEAYYAEVNWRSKKWAQANPDKRREMGHRARAKRLGAPGRWTEAEWQALCSYYGNVCLCCGKAKKLHRDHVIPLIDGGRNDITNLQPLCHNCNSRKWAYPWDYRPDKGEWARQTFRTEDVDS